MCFLPQNNIKEVEEATKNLLEKYKVLPKGWDILCLNSKDTPDPKGAIEEFRRNARKNIARNRDKPVKGLLVLSGRQCGLAVSIDHCDIVILLNNNMSFDMIYQMMFRCMTEAEGKKCGFVIDLNIHRTISTLTDYASLIKPNIHPREAIKYLIQARLINLNPDHWMPTFGNAATKINSIAECAYKLQLSNVIPSLKQLLYRLRFIDGTVTPEQQKYIDVFGNMNRQRPNPPKFDDDDNKIPKGKERKPVENSGGKKEDGDEKEEKPTNYMDVIRHIIPLICLLTIYTEETTFIKMIQTIDGCRRRAIFYDQVKVMWGKYIEEKQIKRLVDIYIMKKNDEETIQIVRTAKEMFLGAKTNPKVLSALIDTYLVPQELEMKEYAEYNTPFELRTNMLDSQPAKFWMNKKNKVLEPSAGKGHFVLSLIDKFMNGLKNVIPDEELRYKHIVEECIFFGELTPTNIFIIKLLINRGIEDKYKLNYYEGDTLQLDPREKWGIDGFFDGVG